MPNNLPRTIYLEFRYPKTDVVAVIGTDCIHYVDGRHTSENAHSAIIEHARMIRRRRPDLELIGYGKPRDSQNRTYSLPEYVRNAANRD